MTDRELLEAAARAAEIEFGPKRAATGGPHLYLGSKGGWWNPLSDDGDRYRLARTLGLRINFATREVATPDGRTFDWVQEPDQRFDEDDEARAIVRAAAAMAPKEKA